MDFFLGQVNKTELQVKRLSTQRDMIPTWSVNGRLDKIYDFNPNCLAYTVIGIEQ